MSFFQKGRDEDQEEELMAKAHLITFEFGGLFFYPGHSAVKVTLAILMQQQVDGEQK